MLSNFQTIQIDPRKLHEAWPFVSRGIADIIRKTKPEWIAEDVYSSLRNNAACLLLSLCDGTPIGFTVHYYSFTPFSNVKECFIWLAYTILPAARPTGLDVDGAVAHTMRTIVEMSHREGCAHITCISPRSGFTKWAAKHGFQFYHSTFRRPL